MLVVDTNVWVAATDPTESGHSDCVAFFVAAAAEGETLGGPRLVIAECAGAASRKTRRPRDGQNLAAKVRQHAGAQFDSLDESLADDAADMAARLFLRGADATYAAVARLHQATLITLDTELRIRAGSDITALTPAEWLASQAMP